MKLTRAKCLPIPVILLWEQNAKLALNALSKILFSKLGSKNRMFHSLQSKAIQALLIFSIILSSAANAFNGSADPSFNSGGLLTSDDITVSSTAIQSDGKILIVGNFTAIGGIVRNRVARLNTDGTLDTTFNSLDITGSVTSVAIQANSKILIAGGFSRVNGVDRGGIARLNSDGSLDTNFDPNANSLINAIAIQSDGKILVGGNFTSVGGGFRHNLARLKPDGTLDTTFDSNAGANGQITSIAIQADEKVLIGGFFSKVNTFFNTVVGVERSRLARLNANGTVDPDFDIDINSVVRAILVQSDGKILIGGGFTSVANAERIGLARLNADGTLQTTFNPSLDGAVSSFAVQGDDKILLGGSFGTIGASERKRIARLLEDGTLDTTFSSNAYIEDTSSTVSSISIQNDGRILIGGSFFTTGNEQTDRIARLDSSGDLDSLFNVGELLTSDGVRILSMVIQSDDKILIGGNFTSVEGTKRNRVARLNANGSIDSSFNTVELINLDKANLSTIDVNAIAVRSDGKVYVAIGRSHDRSLGRGVSRIVRLNIDGTLDSTFSNPIVAHTIKAIATQSDGKVLMGGSFESVGEGSGTQYYIARLNNDGTSDTAFNMNANITPISNGVVNSIAIQDNDKILIGGKFEVLNTELRTNVARLNSDGTLDQTFGNANASSSVSYVGVQGGDKILLGGGFDSLVNCCIRGDLTRLNADGSLDTTFNFNEEGRAKSIYVQNDNRILVSGFLEEVDNVRREVVIRLNVDGTRDTDFNSNITGGVNAIATQADGKLLVGGAAISVANSQQRWVARLEDIPLAKDDELCIPIKSSNGALALLCF